MNASVLNLGLVEYCYYCLEYELLKALWRGKESQNKLGLLQVRCCFRKRFKMHSDLCKRRAGVGMIETLPTSSQIAFLNKLIIQTHHQERERCGSLVPCLRGSFRATSMHLRGSVSILRGVCSAQVPDCYRQLRSQAEVGTAAKFGSFGFLAQVVYNYWNVT